MKCFNRNVIQSLLVMCKTATPPSEVFQHTENSNSNLSLNPDFASTHESVTDNPTEYGNDNCESLVPSNTILSIPQNILQFAVKFPLSLLQSDLASPTDIVCPLYPNNLRKPKAVLSHQMSKLRSVKSGKHVCSNSDLRRDVHARRPAVYHLEIELQALIQPTLSFQASRISHISYLRLPLDGSPTPE